MYRKITNILPSIFQEQTFPLALIILLALSFGSLAGWLGFYQDDWPHVYYGRTLGLPQLLDLYRYTTRPPGSVLYMAGFAILGYKPLFWHLLTLGIRFLTSLFVWLTLREIWPGHKRMAGWAALLFAVYPLFRLQPLAVTYYYHWCGYLLFTISLWSMVQSIRKPGRFWPYWTLSIVTCLAHMFLMEYFLGLELIRPFILWLLLAEETGRFRSKLKKLVKLWLPYVLAQVLFLLYRIYLVPKMQPGAEKNPPVLLYELLDRPLPALLRLLQAVLQDTIFTLATTWSDVFSPNLFAISRPANLLVVLLGILTGLALYYYLTHLKEWEKDTDEVENHWIWSVLLIGLALAMFGLAPGWVTGRSVSQEESLWSQRFGLAALIGASLVIVGLLELFIRNQKYRTVIFVVLVVLSASSHIVFTNDFRWSWIKQTRFYNQLYWRAPYIEEGTALLSDEEVFPFMGDYPVSFALGILYPKKYQSKDMAYWFYSVTADFFEQRESLVSGIPLVNGRYLNEFTGDSLESLVIYYAPEKNQCLWVLRPQDAKIRVLPKILQDIAPVSNLDRIRQAAPQPHTFPVEVFGKEMEPTWCYYYQKADLARQFKEWGKVVALWQAASEAGFRPQNGVEYLPFIDGFARNGDWGQAIKLTMQANRITGAMPKILCPTWEQIASEIAPSLDQAAALAELRAKIRCDE